MRDRGIEIVAAVVVGQRVLGELPEQDRLLAGEHAGVMKLVEHALDPIRRFADVLEEQDAAVDAREVRRAAQVRDHRKIAAPERSGAHEVRSLERALDLVARLVEQPEAMIEGERRGLRRAEIAPPPVPRT